MSSAQVIYDAVQERINDFMENYYEPNMLWLSEVHQNAIKLFNKHGSYEQEVILPRTPAAKRKFVDVEKANCLDKESTLQAGSEFKKLRIDDCSTILECSIADLTNDDSVNNSRSLRPRKQTKQSTNRPKRKVLQKKIESKPIVVSHKFVPPASISNVRFESPQISTPGEGSNSTLQGTMNTSSNATVMRITPHKTPTVKTNSNAKQNPEIFKKIQCQIDFEEGAAKSNTIRTPNQEKPNKLPVEESPCFVPVRKSGIVASTPETTKDNPASIIIDPNQEIQNDVEMEVVNEAVSEDVEEVIVNETDCDETASILKKDTDEKEVAAVQVQESVKTERKSEEINVDVVCENTVEELVIQCPISDEIKIVEETVKDPESPKKTDACKSPQKPKSTSPTKPGKSPPKKFKPNNGEGDVLDDSSRRGTYKIMVNSIIEGKSDSLKTGTNRPVENEKEKDEKKAQKPSKLNSESVITSSSITNSTSNTNSISTTSNVSTINPSASNNSTNDKSACNTTNNTSTTSFIKSFFKSSQPKSTSSHTKAAGNVVGNVKSFVKPTSPRKDVPTVSKQGNIVTNIKSFVKQSPPKKEPVISAARKAAELEKKDLQRQNAIKEERKKKQQIIEERKRLREEREKQMAEQQQKKLEENEKRRLLLEQKEAQIAKNQDEIRKARELEEKQKREARDAKKAELDARRLREEEEKRKKAAELLRGEKRKEEVILRKNEQDEKVRLKKKAEKEMQEKDKLRLAEEQKAIDEQRKKNLYEEKERHRLEVIKKREEEREKERLEKQMREDKNRQAEKEISDAKKREEERQRAKEEERIRLKLKQREEMKLKYQPGYTKTILDVQNGLRSSPRLKELAPMKYTGPTVPLAQRDSIYVDYGIDDLNSDDSTDDESQPAKRIPSWAVGSRLKSHLIKQFYMNLNPDDIFTNCMEPLRLEKIFKKNKKIYFTRSSSAHWNSPPVKGRGYNLS